jgi:hypothetical protein
MSAGRLTDLLGVGVLTRVVPRDVVDEILNECGKREQRARDLPAGFMVYYVMALTLWFGQAYEEVLRLLVGGLRFLGNWDERWKVPSSSAISQARKRLGEDPLRLLFERVAVPLARPGTKGAWYRGLRLMAIDGVVFDAPNTPENDEEFGRGGNHISPAPFPQVRIVGLGECGTHALVAAQVGAWDVYERELAADLCPVVEEDMLVMADRGFYSYHLWQDFTATGAHLLWRVTKPHDLPVLETFPDGSYRSHLLPREIRKEVNRKRKRDGLNVIEPDGIPVRVIEYEITNRGGDTGGTDFFRLITTVLDHAHAPAIELAELYHQRWEFEATLDEIEVHQMGHGRVLRSRSPELVKQELWAFFLTHYAIRNIMHEAADEADIDPDRLSFVRSLRIIRRQISTAAEFSP